MLGLGSDETVSILKVGEEVVPTWANNASSSASNSNYTGAATQAVRAAQQASRTSSSINNNNSSVVNTISIPINIQGNADESTVKLLREESDRIAKAVFKLINKQTKFTSLAACFTCTFKIDKDLHSSDMPKFSVCKSLIC